VDQFIRDGRRQIGRQPRPFAVGHPFHMAHDILEQEGHALEGTIGQLLPGHLAGPFEHRPDNRIERRVVPFDPLDCGFDQLRRFDVLAMDKFREPEPVIFRIIGKCHSDSSPCYRDAR